MEDLLYPALTVAVVFLAAAAVLLVMLWVFMRLAMPDPSSAEFGVRSAESCPEPLQGAGCRLQVGKKMGTQGTASLPGGGGPPPYVGGYGEGEL